MHDSGRPDRSLSGCRVAVTRPPGDTEAMVRLQELGAEVLTRPLIRIEPPEDPEPLRRAAARLREYDWLAFTSINAVRAFAEAQGGRRMARPPHVAVVGSATGRAVADVLGWRVAASPSEFTGEALPGAMEAVAGPLAGARVLWPRAAAAREALGLLLRAAGAVVDDPEAYRTIPEMDVAEALALEVAGGEVDAVLFASPSAVEAYTGAGGAAHGACIGVIGPATAAAAQAAGLPVHVQPVVHTVSAMVDALALHYAARDRRSERES